jgi:PKHD-type hydroxylase
MVALLVILVAVLHIAVLVEMVAVPVAAEHQVMLAIQVILDHHRRRAPLEMEPPQAIQEIQAQ